MRFRFYENLDNLNLNFQIGPARMRIRGSNHDKFRTYLAEKSSPGKSEFDVVPVGIHLENWCRQTGSRGPENWDAVLRSFDEIVSDSFLPLLRDFVSRPDRHVFFQVGDNDATLPCLRSSVVFKESARIGDRAMFYPVGSEPPLSPILSCRHEVSFQGAIKTFPDVRGKIEDGLSRIPGSYFRDTGFYFENLDPESKRWLKRDYESLLDGSKFFVCPRGGGLNSVRFFETLAFGRIPVLVSDDCELPLSGRIPYHRFCVFVPEGGLSDLGSYIGKFEKDNDVSEASNMSRSVYERHFKDLKRFLSSSLLVPVF